MENRIGNSHGVEIPKKSRSLDLKSLYKSRVSKEVQNKNLKRKGSPEKGDDEKRNKRKKSRKAVSLSSLKNVDSNNKKSLDEVYNGGLSSATQDSKDSKLGLSQKLNHSSSGIKSISLSLNDSVIQIPKRKRDFVGRKKFESSQVLKPPGQSSSKVALVDQIAKLPGDDSGTRVESFKIKRKKDFDDFKENIKSESNSALQLEEDGHADHLVANNGESSSKKSRRNRRKKKDFTMDVAKEAAPLIDNSIKICDDSQEDDEENLEENAARMLSSRFDPSCTGFTSNSKASALPPMNGLSFLLSSDRNFASRGSKSLSGSESASVDTAGRVLRPRIQHKEKGNSRKRRHYYEIFSGDLDAYWVLNRRIKVFWPLDQSWYYGLVKDYDNERKLHHVKYDDRDEEWINLRNERFKLLLLPSEVPGKAERKRCRLRNKHSDEVKGKLKPRKEKEKRDLTVEDDSVVGSYMDSEPIISWLAHRVKSSPLRAMKKQKTSGLPTSVPSLLSVGAVNSHGFLVGGSSKRDDMRFSGSPVVSDRLANGERGEESVSEIPSSLKESKLPIVYFRRRFHKTGKASCHASGSNRVSRSAPESVTSVATVSDGFGALEEHNISQGRLDPDGSFWSTGNAGLLKLTIPLVEPSQFRFELSFPVLSVLKYEFGAENFWLFHAVWLLQYGTLITMWPRVHLEMLFVDNIVGLRSFLFEGCLKQTVAFVFLVLSVFHQPNEQGNYAEPQFPVTSIRFRISCIQDLRKQLVFAFYNFSEVNNLKWMYLDRELKRHCLLTRQLPLSECTYDNIKALQNGTNQLLSFSVSGNSSSIEGLRRKSRQGISLMAVSRESTYVNFSQLSSNSNKKHRNFPPFALSFTAAPTFFLSLHLKLLMEHSVAHISFGDHDLTERLENPGSLIADDCSSVEDCSNKGSESTLENNLPGSLKDAAIDERLSSAKVELGTVGVSVCSDKNRIESSQKYQNGNLNVAGMSSSSQDQEKIGSDAIVPLQKWRFPHSETEQCILLPRPLVDRDKSDTGSHSLLNGIRVEIPQFNQFESHVDRELLSGQQSADMSWNRNGSIIPSPNPTAPRSTWNRNRSSLSLGSFTHGWSDGKADFLHNNFGNGPKKPRTQVSYSLPFGGFDYSSKTKSHHQKGLSHKRIRRANEKRSSDVSRGSQRNLELLTCDANVLITVGDRGWRECGAQVVLELFDHNEWKLAVKLSGTTKYSYKAHQFLQPGSTNRYTHAMMWKGGKDWILEFPDRSQWALFKEMHEECYNRNIRAALVKNIPIPGVRLVEENDDNGMEVAFVRCSSKYFRQVETDVEMALDPLRVLYDIDSDDERWILKNQYSSEVDNNSSWDVSEEFFEKTMDMFEKAAYAQQRDQFTSDEIEELMAGVGPMEVIKTIHEHWRQKRQRKGLPLIRHLQPPLWERYQQQVREWELAMTKINITVPNGSQEKVAPIEKPPMFAFCLKPRGLEVPNKGSKQRSQRRFSVSGQSSGILGDHDGFHAFGRRLNGFALGDEKVAYQAHNYESLDDSPLPQTSPSVFSPRDTGSMGYVSMSNDWFDRNHHQKLHRSKSKKFGMLASPNSMQMGSSNQRMMGKRNGIHQWNMGFSEWPSQRHFYSDGSQRYGPEQLDGSDLDEFRLRDASGAAQHALNMAKLKREKAQRLLYRADLAIHKAVVALMTAEAIKASSEDLNGDG